MKCFILKGNVLICSDRIEEKIENYEKGDFGHEFQLMFGRLKMIVENRIEVKT